jgi:hypothetical protein
LLCGRTRTDGWTDEDEDEDEDEDDGRWVIRDLDTL